MTDLPIVNEPTEDERLFAMLIYILSLFFPVMAPLIIWIIKREESAFIDYHGKEYFNFLLSFCIYGVISAIIVLLFIVISFVMVPIGILLAIIVGILVFVLTIIAGIKAFNGEYYKIPFVIRFIK